MSTFWVSGGYYVAQSYMDHTETQGLGAPFLTFLPAHFALYCVTFETNG